MKSDASGTKHKNAVKQSQAPNSVSEFFRVILGVKGEMSNTLHKQEPSTSVLCDNGDEMMISKFPLTSATNSKHCTKGSWKPTNKNTLREEQHKAEILRVLKSFISHILYKAPK